MVGAVFDQCVIWSGAVGRAMSLNPSNPQRASIPFGQAPAVDCLIQRLSPLGATLQFTRRRTKLPTPLRFRYFGGLTAAELCREMEQR